MVPAKLRLTDEQILQALRRRGGRAGIGELGHELGVHRDTLHRRFKRLVSAGAVQPAGRGEYQLALGHLGLNDAAARLVGVLQRDGLEAHLTGFDLLVRYAHQFVFRYPHLVYAEPMSLDAVEMALAATGFVVQRAGAGSRVSTPDSSSLVVLRKQAGAERHRVHGCLARSEKAWVDALREASRDTVPLQFMELGRILRGVIDDGGDVRFLRHYARRLGYLDRVDAAISAEPLAADAADLLQLRAGFRA